MGPIIITSERLRLRTWSLADAPALVELFEHPDVNRFVNDGKPITLQQAERFIERYIRIQNERGWCRWAIEIAEEPDRLAGFCGVGCTFAPDIELGWTLGHDLWGHGYATEAARAALDYLFGVVGFAQIVSAIDPANERSAAVAGRLGMVPDGTLEHEGVLLTRYAIDNPLTNPPRDPRFVLTCDGEPSGSSLHAADD